MPLTPVGSANEFATLIGFLVKIVSTPPQPSLTQDNHQSRQDQHQGFMAVKVRILELLLSWLLPLQPIPYNSLEPCSDPTHRHECECGTCGWNTHRENGEADSEKKQLRNILLMPVMLPIYRLI